MEEGTQTPKDRTLSATVDRASVESILTRHDSTASMLPSPMEHVGSPKRNRDDRNMNEIGDGNEAPMSPPPMKATRSRPNSLIMSAKNKTSRLSLSFPVQLPPNYQTNSFLGNDHPNSDTAPGSLLQSQTSNTATGDPPNDFLQELARQERRVFELREELGRAEGELEGLKKKWAYSEVHKKRSEIRSVEQMVPYSPKDENDGSETGRRSTEMTMDRRKAMLLAGIGRESRRKVLEGRHTRTLSLLSPERSNFSPNSPFSPLVPGSATFSNTSNERSPVNPETTTINGCVPLEMGVARSATLPDLQTDLFKPRNRHSYQNANSKNSANDVLKTGKRLAEDLRAGIWTFVEDLRQATVGDEAVNGPSGRPRNPSITENTQYIGGTGYGGVNSLAASTPKNRSTKGKDQMNQKSSVANREYAQDLHELIPDEFSMPEADDLSAQNTVLQKRKSITAPRQEDLTADDWLNWDSPPSTASKNSGVAAGEDESQRWSSSTFGTDVGELDGSGSTPSKKAVALQREGLQWPTLKPFSPFHLKKTAESLMREWEKSLTPPPEEEDDVDETHGKRLGGFEGQDLLS